MWENLRGNLKNGMKNSMLWYVRNPFRCKKRSFGCFVKPVRNGFTGNVLESINNQVDHMTVAVLYQYKQGKLKLINRATQI